MHITLDAEMLKRFVWDKSGHSGGVAWKIRTLQRAAAGVSTAM